MNKLKEECGSIPNGLGEQLQQIATRLIITQNLQFLELIHVLFDVDIISISQAVIIGVWNIEKLYPIFPQGANSVYDIIGLYGDVLNACSMILLDVFFNLRFLFPFLGLIDGVFDSGFF